MEDVIRHCLGRADKLRKRHEFVSLSRNGKSVSDRYFIMAYQPNRIGHARIGITITRKVGNAVVRNRIKRIVREFFRMHPFLREKSIDINVIAKKPATRIHSARAFASLHILADRIREG